MAKISMYETAKVVTILRGGGEYDAIQMMRAIQEYKTNGETADWHEYSELLSFLEVVELAEIVSVNRDGMTVYRWKGNTGTSQKRECEHHNIYKLIYDHNGVDAYKCRDCGVLLDWTGKPRKES